MNINNNNNSDDLLTRLTVLSYNNKFSLHNCVNYNFDLPTTIYNVSTKQLINDIVYYIQQYNQFSNNIKQYIENVYYKQSTIYFIYYNNIYEQVGT